MKFICLVFILFSDLQAMARAPLPELSIGVHTVQYKDLRRNRPVLIEIWYPAEQEGPLKDSAWVRDVAPSEGRHPLIIMSHGHGGDCRDRSWLVEYLVTSGYIVASVEHHGNSWRSYNLLLSLRFWDRMKDVSFAITKLLREPFFRSKIDQNRIGFVGYSLGGMTGLALAGAKAQNVKQIVKSLQTSFKEIDPEWVEKIDFEEAEQSFFDRRIKAMALLCPATYVFPPEALSQIKMPVALIASEEDEVLPFQEHAFKAIQSLKRVKLKLMKGVSHYAFLNRVSEKGIKEMQSEVHKEAGDFIRTFFKEHF